VQTRIGVIVSCCVMVYILYLSGTLLALTKPFG